MTVFSQAFLARFADPREDPAEAGCLVARDESGAGLRIRILPPLGVDGTRLLCRNLRRALNLRHPNLAALVDIGEEGDRVFVVEELALGERLDRLLESRGPFELREALSCIAQIAAALVPLAAAGIVHDALRPSAIWVDEEGRSRLTRLGLAWAGPRVRRREDWHAWIGAEDGFEAPERRSQFEATEGSDVYSLGALLYAMLVGEGPPSAAGMDVELWRKKELTRLLQSKVGKIPKSVEDLLRRSLDGEPSRRISEVAEFRRLVGLGLRGLRTDQQRRSGDLRAVGPSRSAVLHEASPWEKIGARVLAELRSWDPVRFRWGGAILALILFGVLIAGLSRPWSPGKGLPRAAMTELIRQQQATGGIRKALVEFETEKALSARVRCWPTDAPPASAPSAEVETELGRSHKALLTGLKEGLFYRYVIDVEGATLAEGEFRTHAFRLEGPSWKLAAGRFEMSWRSSVAMAARIRWTEQGEGEDFSIEQRRKEQSFVREKLDDARPHHFRLFLRNEIGERRITDVFEIPSYVSLVRGKVDQAEAALRAIPTEQILSKLQILLERAGGKGDELRREGRELLAALDRDVALGEKILALKGHLAFFFESALIGRGERVSLERALSSADRINGFCRHGGLGFGLSLGEIATWRQRPSPRSDFSEGDERVTLLRGILRRDEGSLGKGRFTFRLPRGVVYRAARLRVRVGAFRWPCALRVDGGQNLFALALSSEDFAAEGMIHVPLWLPGLQEENEFRLSLCSAMDLDVAEGKGRIDEVDVIFLLER